MRPPGGRLVSSSLLCGQSLPHPRLVRTPGVQGKTVVGQALRPAHAAGRCVGGFDNWETPKQAVAGNYLQLGCRGASPGLANKLVKLTFPQISLLKYKLWR